MNKTLIAILQQLNDHQPTTGKFIGDQLGITRAAVWKNIQALQQDYGVPIISSQAVGYKLAYPITFLDSAKITSVLEKKDAALTYFFDVDSTNTYLHSQALQKKYHICIAEYQKQGKGRFDRKWISPLAANLYFSLKTNLIKEVSELSGLSLAVAVALGKTLDTLYPSLNAKIKWPNDIYVNNKKLAGILIEVKAESNGMSQVIIGVGVNVNMSHSDQVDQPWTSIKEVLDKVVDRTELSIMFSKQLIDVLQEFEHADFSQFKDAYHHYDYLQNKKITLLLPNAKKITGLAKGVSDQGLLVLESKDGVKHFASGEVSIKKL